MSGFLKTWANPEENLQRPFEVAVVMPSILRPEIAQAVRSVFAQDLRGRIQLLIGLDQPGDMTPLEVACAERPAHCVVQVLQPGYSTSVRHGGLAAARDGGALRTVLSYLANSPYIAYLDDDNWFREDHLRRLRQAAQRAPWAYSRRWFVHPKTRRPIAEDIWESVGPGKGVFQQHFGGWVDPNCLMLNKQACEEVLALWARPPRGDTSGMQADRGVFDHLMKHYRAAESGQASSFYTLNEADSRHAWRVTMLAGAYHKAGAA